MPVVSAHFRPVLVELSSVDRADDTLRTAWSEVLTEMMRVVLIAVLPTDRLTESCADR